MGSGSVGGVENLPSPGDSVTYIFMQSEVRGRRESRMEGDKKEG